MALTKPFIEKYNKLPEFKRYGSQFYFPGGKKEWVINKVEFTKYVNSGNDGIDFLWYSIIFNLFSKTLYCYSPENYKYCNDLIHWKFGEYEVLNKIYLGKFKNFIDDNFCEKRSKIHEKYYNYSKNKIDFYCEYFINLKDWFAKEGCELKYEIFSKIVKEPAWHEEFSTSENDLSFIYYKSLLTKID